MAISINGNGGGSRYRGRFHGISSLSEINVTPFVDVLLVLLIIFMLTAHVMEFGIEVNVPEVKLTRESARELPVVTITRNGWVYLNEKEININELAPAVLKRFGKTPVYLQADKQTVFQPIAQVMAALGEAKIDINVVTKPEDVTGKK